MAQKRIHKFFSRHNIAEKNTRISPVDEQVEVLCESRPANISDVDDVTLNVSSSTVEAAEGADEEREPEPEGTSNSASNTIIAPATAGFENPCQPKKFSFPGRRFGTETFERSFQPGWFSKWQWVHYVSDKDYVLCFVCCKASEKGFHHAEGKGSSFTSGGFRNWRKATTKFAHHDRSDMHLGSVRMLSSLNQKPIIFGLFDSVFRLMGNEL